MQCQFEYVRSTLWRCRQCGRQVGTYWLAEGVLAPPKPARLPPCGWEPLVEKTNGHLWVERYQGNNPVQRRWQCLLCRSAINLPATLKDAQIRQELQNQPPCTAPWPKR